MTRGFLAPRCSEAEQRKRNAAPRYKLEMEFRKVGWGNPMLIYDEKDDLFFFIDGRFVFSCEHAY